MNEPRPQTAREVVDDLLAHPLTPEEIARRRGPISERNLRLVADVPTITMDDSTKAREALGQHKPDEVVAIRDAEMGVVAMLVPTEKYLRLIADMANNMLTVVDDPDLLGSWHVEDVTDSQVDDAHRSAL